MALSTLTPRLYNISGAISASKKFSELTYVNPNLTTNTGDWISIRNCARCCLHVIVSSASSFNCKLSAFVSGINPNEVVGITINGARYNGGTSDVVLTTDGEYILDITATSAAFIMPYFEHTAGSANIDLIVSAKSI